MDRMTAGHTRRAMGAALALSLLASACSAENATAQGEVQRSQHHPYRVERVAGGLQNPWGIAFLPSGDMLVTERPGRLRLIRGGTLQPEPIAGVPEVFARGQGGLLDVALHPHFATNRLVYLSYSKPGPEGATTAVIRGRLDGNRLAEVEEIFEARAWSGTGLHFGSRLLFDREGYLFVSVGERGSQENAQNLGNHAGKIMRLHDDGRVPTDNPFVGRSGVLPEIWAYGIRSPQGLAIHPATGEIWESEHGPRGGDEINHIRPGRNFGWPVITYGINYNGSPITDITSKEGMEQPAHQWTPSIAASGLAIYEGAAFPQWRGDYFVGALAGKHLARVRLRNGRTAEEEKLLTGLDGRIRDVRVGPDGFLYVLTDERDGGVYRIRPAS